MIKRYTCVTKGERERENSNKLHIRRESKCCIFFFSRKLHESSPFGLYWTTLFVLVLCSFFFFFILILSFSSSLPSYIRLVAMPYSDSLRYVSIRCDFEQLSLCAFRSIESVCEIVWKSVKFVFYFGIEILWQKIYENCAKFIVFPSQFG